MRERRSIRLRTKMIMIYVLLMAILFVLTALIGYLRYTRVSREQTEQNVELLLQNAVSEANLQLDKIRQSGSFLSFYANDSNDSIVQTLSDFREGKSYTAYDVWRATQYCRSVFQNLLVSNDDIRGIYIFTSGDVVFSDSSRQRELTIGYDPRKDDWYQKTLSLSGSYFITRVMPDDMFRTPADSIYFACSISDIYTHTFLGVLLMECEPSVLSLDHVNPMPNFIRLHVANRDTGEILYSGADTGNTFIRTQEFSVPLDFSPLTLTMECNYAALLSANAVARPFLLMNTAVGLLCAVIFSLLLTIFVFRPLEELTEIMKRQSDTTQIFNNPYQNRDDEIATLYTEYARMLEQIDNSIKRNYKDKLIVMDAQMKSLEARINSHFLFNTLESINSMAELSDNTQIADMALALGDMFRYTIKTPSELVSLADEMKHVSDYVSIQRIRFSNRFSLAVDIPPEMYSLRVLKLILQPLVENAFYHGLQNCSKGDTITVRGSVEDKTIILTVSDNGQGMSRETVDELNAKLQEEASFTQLGHRTKQSIGLKNVQSRIELYYGNGYGMHVRSEEGKGTDVTIRIPILS